MDQSGPMRKLAIVLSKGALDEVLPGLMMANGARMSGIDTHVFLMAYGLYTGMRDFQARMSVATVGNAARRLPGPKGLRLPGWLGIVPGLSALATHKLKATMEQHDIPPVDEFVQMIRDSGGHFYACKASVDMFGLQKEDFVPQVERIITMSEFYDLAAGGQLVFV